MQGLESFLRLWAVFARQFGLFDEFAVFTVFVIADRFSTSVEATSACSMWLAISSCLPAQHITCRQVVAKYAVGLMVLIWGSIAGSLQATFC